MFHVTFNNHSDWKLLKACRIFFFRSICTQYMYVSICFEFDNWCFGFFFFFSLISFAYVKEKRKKVMNSTSNVYMN